MASVLSKLKSAPIIFNKSEPMMKVRVVTPKDDTEKALKALHEIGALDIQEESASEADVTAIELERDQIRESLRRVESMLAYVKEKETVALTKDVGEMYQRPLASTHSDIDLVHSKIARIVEKAGILREELSNLQEFKKYLAPLAAELSVGLDDLAYSGGYLYTNLYVFVLGVSDTFIDQTGDLLFDNVAVSVDEEVVVYVVARATDGKAVNSIAEGLGAKSLSLPCDAQSMDSYLTGLDTKIPQLEKEIEDLTEEILSNAKENLEAIVLLQSVLTAEDERLAFLSNAYSAKYVTVVEGWTAENDVEAVTSQMQGAVDTAYVEARKPSKTDEPPSKLKNVKGVKPFEVIVNLFSVPKYGGWDPTPIVAYFFAAFFGLMFADVVYGVMLLLSAKFLLHKLVDDPTTDGFKLFRKVLYTGGTVGLILGLLAGNYLGDFYHRPLGLLTDAQIDAGQSFALIDSVRHWLGKPINFLELSLWMGLFHVNIAHAIGLKMAITQRNKAVIISKIALFTMQIALIPIITSSILGSGRLPAPPDWFIYMGLISIIAIISAAIMERGGFGAIFWLFDVTGIIGD
ncbi:MAG: hypothetical protein HN837_06380, partial [Chloroflexi bacterium]|nr:hypothetical protein [Chloroflexota bacterium]